MSGKRVIAAANVPHILAEMTMEGLYTGSGDWAFEVGLPGKSGVGGGILAVAPGKLAIAAFSPPLDPAGNSVRAQKAVATVAPRASASTSTPAEGIVHDELARGRRCRDQARNRWASFRSRRSASARWSAPASSR